MAEIKQKLKTPSVPNYIIIDNGAIGRKQDRFIESPKVSVGDLPDETIEEICKEWREQLFNVARKQRATKD